MVVILALETGTVRAQQRARLTLAQALELADRHNLDLAAARARRAVAQSGFQIARQRPNPSVNFNVLRDEPHEGWWISHPIELGGKRARRVDVAGEEAKLTDVEIDTLARQVRQRTREAYYNLALARADTARQNHLLELAQRLRQIAQERFDAGAVAQLEVLQASLEVSRSQADFQIAQQQEKVALSELNTLLNEPAGTPWELGESLYDLPEAVSLPQLIDLAYQSNSDLQHLAQEEKVEQSHRALLRAERIPDLDLEYGLDFNAPHDFRVGPRSQLSLALPIFSRNQGEIAQSLANQRVLEAETSATKRSVAGQVESAYLELEARRSQAEIYQKSLVPVARQLESMAEESYRAGKTDILSVLTAQQNVQQVEQSYLQSLFAVQSAFATLEVNVGAPLSPK